MIMVRNYNQNAKGTLCHDNDCVTVYGETASFVNGVVKVFAVVTFLRLLYKELKQF